jgi:hypothetical protein
MAPDLVAAFLKGLRNGRDEIAAKSVHLKWLSRLASRFTFK